MNMILSQVLSEMFEGTVLRSMRSINPDQEEYSGLVCVGSESKTPCYFVCLILSSNNLISHYFLVIRKNLMWLFAMLTFVLVGIFVSKLRSQVQILSQTETFLSILSICS